MKILENLFLREKPAKIMIALKTLKQPIYATILSKEADCTYSHTVKILNALRKLGLIKFEKKGRIKTVTLTDDGWDIAHNLESIIRKFEKIEGEEKPKEEKKGEKNKKSK